MPVLAVAIEDQEYMAEDLAAEERIQLVEMAVSRGRSMPRVDTRPRPRPAPQVAVPVPDVADIRGSYSAAGMLLRVRRQRNGNFQIRVYRNGRTWVPVGMFEDGQFVPYREGNVTRNEEEAINRVLLADRELRQVYGEAYATVTNRCYRCGKFLTVPVSVHRGLGPRCNSIVNGGRY